MGSMSVSKPALNLVESILRPTGAELFLLRRRLLETRGLLFDVLFKLFNCGDGYFRLPFVRIHKFTNFFELNAIGVSGIRDDLRLSITDSVWSANSPEKRVEHPEAANSRPQS